MTKFVYSWSRHQYFAVDPPLAPDQSSADSPDLPGRDGEPACGTVAAYHRHRRARQTPCDACRYAVQEAIQRWH